MHVDSLGDSMLPLLWRCGIECDAQLKNLIHCSPVDIQCEHKGNLFILYKELTMP